MNDNSSSIAGEFALALHEFDAVAPRIFGVEATRAGDCVVVNHGDAASGERLPQFIEVGDGEGGMRFFRGREILLDADVQLAIAALEPAAAARA